MSCHSHLLGLRMYPPVYVVNKESALSFIHLKQGMGVGKALRISKSWRGAPRLGPSCQCLYRKAELSEAEEGSQLVDNAWMPSDPRVKLLSGRLSLVSQVPGRESCQLSVSAPRRGLHHREAPRRNLPNGLLSQAPCSLPVAEPRPPQWTQFREFPNDPGTDDFSGHSRESQGGNAFTEHCISGLRVAIEAERMVMHISPKCGRRHKELCNPVI